MTWRLMCSVFPPFPASVAADFPVKRFHGFQKDLVSEAIHHLALGFFDGVHLGHQAVIRAEPVRPRPETSGVLTFWPHPMATLAPAHAPVLLTSQEEKIEILHGMGLGYCIIIPFDQAFSQIPAPRFLDQLEMFFPRLKSLSVGPNFRFGHQRQGTPVTLAEWADKKDLRFYLADFFLKEGHPVSSTRIRELLTQGKISQANVLLSRPFRLSGTVEKGAQMGKHLGFPTANIAVSKRFELPLGVYAAVGRLPGGQKRGAAVNIGKRPTFNRSSNPVVEAHLLEWSGNLYDQKMELNLIEFLRPEHTFNNRTELIAQIEEDIHQCQSLVGPHLEAE